MLLAKLSVAVSILPQKTFLEAIGGEKISVELMVLPGNSPHNYDPKPSQMKNIAKASLYFAIGVEFENIWLSKFSNLNKSMKIIDLTKNIEKIAISSHHHKDKQPKDLAKDPHIWTSPKNVKIIATNIYEALAKADSINEPYYKKNYDLFLNSIESTNNKLKSILAKFSGKKFMVFHPSWGYFARDYNLVQMPVELDGKRPKPRELIELIKKARAEKVTAIFTQPEFSDATAKVMANELSIGVIKVSPLNPNWSKNLLNIANAIAGQK
jgi:zinc transport system substrate-binding protein